jgi:hypothetical protein
MSTELIIELEFEDRQEAIELLNAIKVEEIRAGYKVEASRFDVLQLLIQAGQNIVANKELLLSLFGMATPAAGYLLQQSKNRAKPFKVIMEVDGAEITLEAPDVESAAKMMEKFQKEHPKVAENVSAKSKAKLKGKLKGK